jgi:hypothetical protein
MVRIEPAQARGEHGDVSEVMTLAELALVYESRLASLSTCRNRRTLRTPSE